jgi:predicted porin
MTQFKKTKLAAAVLAATIAAPASAVSWSAGDWEVSYTGTINLFYNQLDQDDVIGGNSSHLLQGLLPAFHTMKVVGPATNGLTGTGQISFAPDSSSSKTSGQNKSGNAIDMREVFFNVDGSFGSISVGRTLSLFSRGAILNDMTLFGMGANGGIDAGGTGLGRIAHGYTYAEFNTRFAWKSPDMNGFNLEVGIFDPQEGSGGSTGNFETDTPQFQVALNYSTSFDGGSVALWADGIYQEMEGRTNAGTGATDFNTSGEVKTHGIGLGVSVSAGGLGIVASMYDGEALGSVRQVDTNSYQCTATQCQEAEADGYYIQATYNISPATKIGVSYGETNQDASSEAPIECLP